MEEPVRLRSSRERPFRTSKDRNIRPKPISCLIAPLAGEGHKAVQCALVAREAPPIGGERPVLRSGQPTRQCLAHRGLMEGRIRTQSAARGRPGPRHKRYAANMLQQHTVPTISSNGTDVSRRPGPDHVAEPAVDALLSGKGPHDAGSFRKRIRPLEERGAAVGQRQLERGARRIPTIRPLRADDFSAQNASHLGPEAGRCRGPGGLQLTFGHRAPIMLVCDTQMSFEPPHRRNGEMEPQE